MAVKKIFAFFKNHRGISLVELITAIGISSILLGVGTVTYRKTQLKVKLQTFKEEAELFVPALRNCLTASSWEVKLPVPPSGCTPSPTDKCDIIKPCDTAKKIGYTTPKKMVEPDYYDAGTKKYKAKTHTTDATATDPAYFCADFLKEIQGKKYQIHVIVPPNAVSGDNYQVRCKQVTTPVALSDSNCTKDATQLCDCKHKKFPEVGPSDSCPAPPLSPAPPGPSTPGPSNPSPTPTP